MAAACSGVVKVAWWPVSRPAVVSCAGSCHSLGGHRRASVKARADLGTGKVKS